MSMIRLVVREADRDWSGDVHGSHGDAAVAALSADPTTLAELEAATARFAKPTPGRGYLSNLSRGLDAEPYDAGLVVIDLAGRLVYVESTYSLPGRKGSVHYHNGRCGTDKSLDYHLADDWLFVRKGSDWRIPAERRRRERLAKPPLDARAVFYGRPLFEFIAKEAFAARASAAETAANARDPAITAIHVAWMLTPCDDLGGASPREVAIDGRREHIGWDLQDRCQAWDKLGFCPPGLDRDSDAYRFGGFGTNELVVYYELVRVLLLASFRLAAESSDSADEFLADAVPKLEGVRDLYLNEPDPELSGRKPRVLIHRERARLPETMKSHEEIIDADCPCCQMIAGMKGQMYWFLDGCNMDDDFAFDMYHRTREDFDKDRREMEEHSRRFHAEFEEKKRLGVEGYAPDADPVWSQSFYINDSVEVPLGIRVFGVGCHLAELITLLRESKEPQADIDRLNRHFGNLREVLLGGGELRATALIDPVADRFAETLTDVAAARPQLSRQCEALQDDLRKLLEPPPEETDDDPYLVDYP